MRHYTLGDEIRVRITIEHTPNLEDVWAIFSRREAPQTTITLIGSVDETEQLEESEHALATKRSTVVLASLVDFDHYPGLYTFYRVGVRTVGGRNIRALSTASRRVDDRNAAFYVEDEPTDIWAISAEMDADEEYYE